MAIAPFLRRGSIMTTDNTTRTSRALHRGSVKFTIPLLLDIIPNHHGSGRGERDRYIWGLHSGGGDKALPSIRSVGKCVRR